MFVRVDHHPFCEAIGSGSDEFCVLCDFDCGHLLSASETLTLILHVQPVASPSSTSSVPSFQPSCVSSPLSQVHLVQEKL